MIVKHETISQILSEEIAGMKPGDRLQTVRELAARFAVSTRTMNKALKPLFSRGLIIADGTRGCFVNSLFLYFTYTPVGYIIYLYGVLYESGQTGA